MKVSLFTRLIYKSGEYMEKKGYCTTTHCMRLYCEHPEWVKLTVDYYNKVLTFYYEYLLLNRQLLSLTNQKLLRELEIKTLGEKKKEKEAEYPLPYEKVPLYFRRAAINTAISMTRSFQTKHYNWKQSIGKPEPKPAKNINASPIFYKGMYRNFLASSIELKLWNGKKWIWVECTFKKQIWKPELKLLSPTLKLYNKKIMLHVPVVSIVEDVRTLQERIESKEKYCAIAFPNNDNLAVLAIMDENGHLLDSLFIKGEKELTHRRNYLINQIKKSKACMKDESKSIAAYPHFRRKITNLTDHFAHLVSRKIIDYCKEKEIKIIILPNYNQSINFNTINYLNRTNYDWIGRRIIQYIKYKAFKEGIIVIGVNPTHTADCCHLCGAVLYKYNEGYSPNIKFFGGKRYVCQNGHQGSTGLNNAMNLGNKFLKQRVKPVSKDTGEAKTPYGS